MTYVNGSIITAVIHVQLLNLMSLSLQKILLSILSICRPAVGARVFR